MSTDQDSYFTVDLCDDGSVKIGGKGALEVLWRLVVAAKFQMELSAEHLLSPYLNGLLDELAKGLPEVEPLDWANPAILTPPELLKAVEVVRKHRDLHGPGEDLEKLLLVALKPFDVPKERLGLPGAGSASA